MPTFETTAPTSDAIFESSKLKWARLGYEDSAAISEIVASAIVYVSYLTGRYYSDWDPPATVPNAVAISSTQNLIPLMNRAVRMRVEQQAKQDQASYLDGATDDVVASFTAGPYSETRRDSTRRGEQKAINGWPELNMLLWMLMTDERREYWTALLTGKVVPDFIVQEVEWGLIGTHFDFASPFPTLSEPWGT